MAALTSLNPPNHNRMRPYLWPNYPLELVCGFGWHTGVSMNKELELTVKWS